MTFSMTRQEKGDLLIPVALNTINQIIKSNEFQMYMGGGQCY
jgi:hypothetical protein